MTKTYVIDKFEQIIEIGTTIGYNCKTVEV